MGAHFMPKNKQSPPIKVGDRMRLKVDFKVVLRLKY